MIKTYETKKLETERLVIDRGTIDDYIKVYEYDFAKLRDINGVFKYEKYDTNIVRSWFKDGMENFYKKIENKHEFSWIIYLKNVLTPIGDISCENEDLKNNEIEIAFNIHPNYWGNGYIVEAVKEVVKFLFEIGYKNLICSYTEGNTKSKKAIVKIGFVFHDVRKEKRNIDGILLDDYRMILKEK